VYRDAQGVLHECSAVCTHLGCVVQWNAGEKSWDCPCHGSRFGIDGAILNGPARQPLAPGHAQAAGDLRRKA
jgi:Rieske Fe-S protein